MLIGRKIGVIEQWLIKPKESFEPALLHLVIYNRKKFPYVY